MSDIGRQFRNVRFSPNIFTPYPGIPIWPQLRELGVHEPKICSNGWTCRSVPIFCLGYEARELARLDRMLDYFLLHNQFNRQGKVRSSLAALTAPHCPNPNSLATAFQPYSFPWELWLSHFSERIVRRRSLVTGQELPKEPANAC